MEYQFWTLFPILGGSTRLINWRRDQTHCTGLFRRSRSSHAGQCRGWIYKELNIWNATVFLLRLRWLKIWNERFGASAATIYYYVKWQALTKTNLYTCQPYSLYLGGNDRNNCSAAHWSFENSNNKNHPELLVQYYNCTNCTTLFVPDWMKTNFR